MVRNEVMRDFGYHTVDSPKFDTNCFMRDFIFYQELNQASHFNGKINTDLADYYYDEWISDNLYD